MGAGVVSAESRAQTPNIVFVLTDQWRASATGYAGDPNVKTPNLDRLAQKSLNFINTVSVCPVCTPYRAALMTGRFPTSTGMFLNDVVFPDSEYCIAEMFKEAGYDTAYIGKWHLDGQGRRTFIPPERRQGWDFWQGAECDHNYVKSHYYEGRSSEMKFWQGYDAYDQTESAKLYLRTRSQSDKPFILMLSYGTPHFPHQLAPEDMKALYPPERIILPPNVPADQQQKAREEAQGYYAHCTALDKCIGDLLAVMEQEKLLQNTIFIFTSDHGEMLGAHGAKPYSKQVPWSESALVPFLFHYPALHGAAGRVVETPVTTPDISATLLGLAGIKIPATVEGENLAPMLRAGKENPGRVALYMNPAPFMHGEFDREYRAVRSSTHTYVRGINGPWMLFDDRKDPYQTNNLAANPESAGLLAELDRKLSDELKRIGDNFRPAASYLEEWGYETVGMGTIPMGPGKKFQMPRRNANISNAITWIGPKDGLWSDPANWTPNAVPFRRDSVLVGTKDAVKISGSVAEAGTVTISAPLPTGGITLDNTPASRLEIYGDLNQNGGTFSVRKLALSEADAVIKGNYNAAKGILNILQKWRAKSMLHVSGNLTAGPEFKFRFGLNKAKEFGSVSVDGSVCLGGAQLEFWGLDGAVCTNSRLVLIRSTSAGTLSGTFSNAVFNVTSYDLNNQKYVLRAGAYDADGIKNDVYLEAESASQEK
jgi:arylsulfatase A-like enzyme